MINEELLEQINTRFDTLKQGQKRLERGQTHTNTALEALAAGQQDIREKVGGLQAGQKAIRSEMATKADIQDVDAKLVKRVNRQEKRIDDLEKEAGLPNPH